jgi:hypothetical protein
VIDALVDQITEQSRFKTLAISSIKGVVPNLITIVGNFIDDKALQRLSLTY